MALYPTRTFLLLFSALLPFAAASAQTPACTNASLSGAYFYTFQGAATSVNQSVPYAELGKLVADGRGGITGSSLSSQNGSFASGAISGSYLVAPNCTGSMILSVNSQPVDLAFQIVDNGLGIVLGYAKPAGIVAAGRAYLITTIAATQCSNATFSGTYGYSVTGPILGVPYAETGQIISDGNGAVTLSSILDRSGTVTQVSGGGTYSLLNDCSGTLQISDSFGVHNYQMDFIPASKLALLLETDAGAVGTGIAKPAAPAISILPDIVSGGGFYTALYFNNQSDFPAQFQVNFFGDDGNALTVPSAGSSAVILNTPPRGTAVLELPNTGSLVQGYASVPLPAGVTAHAVFRKSAAGVSDQEAYAAFSTASATISSLIFDDVNVVTAVAIVNPSAVPAVITITARDTSGNIIGTSSVSLAPHAKTESVLRSLPGLSGVAGLRGSAVFSATGGNVAVLGLRFDGAAFTSVPAINQ